MATIRRFGVLSQLRSEASHYVIRYRNGRPRQSGRGLVFWFRPETASISELPMDDREMTLFVRGRSADFQAVAVQGSIGWHVADPERLAARVDFSLDLRTGRLQGEPVERIEARIAGLANQSVLQFLGTAPVRALLDAGPEALRGQVQATLANDPSLAEIGVAVVSVRLTNLAPSSELERALQTPTYEALQQKADEATFARRALAVEKERAIAENELATKTELARRESLLIAEEAQNARNRAQARAEAEGIEAGAEAERIRMVEGARAEAERARVAIYRDVAPGTLLGLAAQALAGKLDTIEHVNVTPDLLATLLGEVRRPASLPAR
ncbi:band 7 protein [Methylorubrum extorquens]|uniref:SPFH domain-containing protein n=1 Tax=Methylorubrum extorquens TaxID=408 RepID=UPI0009727A53|nr:SPFH domain-containing protein [Methylorubrum extorquens]MDF9863649.1 regulator of protease activity HflC (stomatin/prohibitin superfamily) [Methylorubrum pseudosasae]MDH6637250.1 regulator of protease activity HflC (stomatin/prohibitin superfamily) [Methylobacterium sp. SuP10 SLI 274]MDH6666430.1 regulator of protease activity HflC (stomatin/prohibitin superfamily) [Methylorubrum zatmanii]APX85491.1 band 7 protein [Methylorubrum extorquens]MCP1538405.1 regulator of protease activity HflC (